jgi:hypothetical protein
MNTLQNLITSTEVQRNYKMVANRAKVLLDEGLVVMTNNKPEFAFMRFDLYDDLISIKRQIQVKNRAKEKVGLDAVFGTWTKEEADEFDKVIEEEFERIDPEDWK